MGDIFVSKEARDVLAHKNIAVIGGSNMRGIYKDLLWLINDSSIIPKEVLGEKLEKSCPDFNSKRCQRVAISRRVKKIFSEHNRDERGEHSFLHPGRTYIEPRFYNHVKKDITLSFRFVTRVWSPELEKFLNNYEEDYDSKLDLIIMNSVLWDVNRWGPFGIRAYKENLGKLLACVKSVLSDQGMFIWLTAQPGSKELNSGAMEQKGLEFQKKTTRFNVVEANFFAAHKVAEAGFDVIDLHYYFLLQTFRRNRDGIHWTPEANRYVTNMILTHIALSEGKPLPGRNKGDLALERVIFMADVAKGTLTNDIDIANKIAELERLSSEMVKPDQKGLKRLPPVEALTAPNINEGPLIMLPESHQPQMQTTPDLNVNRNNSQVFYEDLEAGSYQNHVREPNSQLVDRRQNRDRRYNNRQQPYRRLTDVRPPIPSMAPPMTAMGPAMPGMGFAPMSFNNPMMMQRPQIWGPWMNNIPNGMMPINPMMYGDPQFWPPHPNEQQHLLNLRGFFGQVHFNGNNFL